MAWGHREAWRLDERNMAGEEFLQFCAVNQLTVMNTWFQKKDIYFGMWMHPATKKYHMIDLIVMRAAQRVCCLDDKVMREDYLLDRPQDGQG